MRTRRAFTVVELMITMAILVLLIGLLVPTFAKMRKSALTAKCLSNLKSLEQAHWLYLSDHKGRFVNAQLPHGGGVAMNEELSWVKELRPYYSSELVLRSPVDVSPHWPAESAGGGGMPIPPTTDHFRPTSYGLNSYLTEFSLAAAIGDQSKAARSLGRVPDAANTVHFLMMAFQGKFAGSDHVHPDEWWQVPLGSGNEPWRLAAVQMQIDAHGGEATTLDPNNPDLATEASPDARSNYAFLDGHVETLMFSQVYVNQEVNRFDPEVSRFFTSRTSTSQ